MAIGSKTHRLPDVSVSLEETIIISKSALELSLLPEGSHVFRVTAEYLSSKLAMNLQTIDKIKPNKNFNGCGRFDLYRVEIAALRSNNERHIDIKFTTNWKFYSNHKTNSLYNYAIRLKLY